MKIKEEIAHCTRLDCWRKFCLRTVTKCKQHSSRYKQRICLRVIASRKQHLCSNKNVNNINQIKIATIDCTT